MSFQDELKSEILTALPKEQCCARAFCSAVARQKGSIEISGRRMNLAISVANREEGLALIRLFKSLYPVEIELRVSQSGDCGVVLPHGMSKQALFDLELMDSENDAFVGFRRGTPEGLLRKTCCKKSYLLGLLLSCAGVYVSGGKSGYSLELHLTDEALAEDVTRLLGQLGLPAKSRDRGEFKEIYIHDKDVILDALGMLGLTESYLKLHAIIDDREIANNINRRSICEAANIDKTVSASAKQIVAIMRLKEKGVFDRLPAALKQTADARTANPEASLKELADMLGVSKSCLGNRFRRLIELAQNC